MMNDEKLDLILSNLEKQDTKLTALENGMEEVKTTLEKHGEMLEKHDTKLTALESGMEEVKTTLEKHDTKFETMERDIKDIKIVLENEIRVNIQRIAEGHLDISRNIQKLIKPNSEVEMMAIKVGMLETDVRELKQKIS